MTEPYLWRSSERSGDQGRLKGVTIAPPNGNTVATRLAKFTYALPTEQLGRSADR